jgi:gliding motility-associated-like protein
MVSIMDYQWYKNNIAVGTNDSLYIDAALADGDSVWVVMTANLGCPVNDTSNHILMTVKVLPVVDQPTDKGPFCNGTAADITEFGITPGIAIVNWVNDNTSIGLAASGSGDISGFQTFNNSDTIAVANVTATPTLNGCTGASVTFTYKVYPTVRDTQTLTLCYGQSLSVGANTYTSNGTYNDTLVGASVKGCDSLVTTNLTIRAQDSVGQTLVVCYGSSVAVGSHIYNATGIYTDTLFASDIHGCDSIITTDLTIRPQDSTGQTLVICYGNSITVGSQIHNATGIYTDTLFAADIHGCDSIVTTDLTIRPQNTSSQTFTFCYGGSVTVGSVVHNTTGIYIDTLAASDIHGCDSIVTTDLTIRPKDSVGQILAVCYGGSVTVGSTVHNASGIYNDTIFAADRNGCDSIVTTSLTVYPNDSIGQVVVVCYGGSVAVGSAVHNVTGVYTDTLFASDRHGCDSIVTTNLTVLPNDSVGQTLTVCFGGSVTVGSTIHNVAGVYTDTLFAADQHGCDSIVTTNLTIRPQDSTGQTLVICYGGSITVGSTVHNASGVYTDTLFAADRNGCDSIVTTDLTIRPQNTSSQTLTLCYGGSVKVGSTIHNATGIYTDTLVASDINGCDSIVTTDLTIRPKDSIGQTLAVCYGGSVTVGSTVHNTTGVYNDTLFAADRNGCDSIVTTNLTVYPKDSIGQTLTICTGASVTVGTTVHNATGVFTDTLFAADRNGCDSIVTTDLTVNPIPDVNPTADQTICNNGNTTAVTFTGSVGGTVFNWTGTNSTIGLATSGNGNIASFTATNSGTAPVSDTIIVTPSYTNNSVTCTGTPDTFIITVNPTPTVIASADQVLCNNSNTTTVSFTGAVPGTVYYWTGTDGTIGISTSNSGDITSFTAVNTGNTPVIDTIIVTPSYTNNSTTCTGVPDTFTITVNPTPTVNPTADQALCNNTATTTVTFTGAVAGTVYNWTGTNATIGLAASGTGDIASFTATNSGSVAVIDTIIVTPSYTNAGVTCTGPSDTFTITVNPTPIMTVPADQALCNGFPTSSIFFTNTVLGTTYSWTGTNSTIGLPSSGNGDILSFTAVNPTTSDVIDTITVIPTSSQGCVGAAVTFHITVHPTPHILLGANVAQCGGNVKIDAGNSGSTFLWSDGVTTQIDTASTSGIYTVTVTSPYGCIDSASKTIYIRSAPVLNLGPTQNTCADSTILDAGNPGDTYLWTGGSTSQFLTVTTTGSYSVTVTDTAGGCSSTGSVQVNINPMPMVNLGPDTAICGGSLVLDAKYPGAIYLWSNGDTTRKITVTATGNYTVTVTAPGGCTASSSIFVTVYPKPNLGADVTDSICPFTRTNLYYYYINSGLTLTYNTSTPNSVDTGTYTVIGTNSNGCADTALIRIIYRQTPNAGPDKTDSVCVGYKYNLTTLYPNLGFSSYTWNTPNPTAVDTGTYILAVTGANGCSDTAIATIIARTKPNLGSNKTDSVCRGYTYNLTTLYPNTGYTSYTWTGVANDSAVNVGTYQLVVTNGSGCTDTAYATITERQQPIVTIPSYQNQCSTNPAFPLTGAAPAGGKYYVDNVLDSIFRTPVLGAGIHHVVYVYTNASGCTDSASHNVIIYPQPHIIDTIALPTLCSGSHLLNLNNYFSPQGGIFSGEGVSGIYFYPSLVPAGPDSITYIYTDELGCKDTAGKWIDILPSVHVTLHTDQSNLTICKGQSITFTASGAVDYQFFVNDSAWTTLDTTSTFTTTALSNHDQIKVVGTNGCSSDTSDYIIIDVNPLPTVIAGPDTTIDLGQSVQLYAHATGSSALVYTWTPDSFLNVITIPNPVYSGPDTITFHVKVTDASGCIATAPVTINVNIPDNVLLPNVITPNGDGKNDLWVLNEKINLAGSHLVIFNRWGELVYETDNYNNDWGGTYKATGQKVPDGTYYYVLTVPAQHNHTYKGPINVLDSDGN